MMLLHLMRRQRGNTGGGFLAGLLLGLLIALGVALYITHAPLPFTNHKVQAGDRPLDRPVNGDPNKSLYEKDIREGRVSSEAATGVRNTQPVTPNAPESFFTPVPSSNAVGAVQTGFYLQTGSFRNADDADQLHARLALAGVEATVSQATIDGMSVNRVRVGPFNTAEDAYRARARLTENGFEARLVKPTTP